MHIITGKLRVYVKYLNINDLIIGKRELVRLNSERAYTKSISDTVLVTRNNGNDVIHVRYRQNVLHY